MLSAVVFNLLCPSTVHSVNILYCLPLHYQQALIETRRLQYGRLGMHAEVCWRNLFGNVHLEDRGGGVTLKLILGRQKTGPDRIQ
jgi:hypothetical protein